MEATMYTIQVAGKDFSGVKKNPNERYSIYGYSPSFTELADEHAQKMAPVSLWQLLLDMRKSIHDNADDNPDVGVVNSHRQFLDTGSCVIAKTQFGRQWLPGAWGVTSEWVLGVGLGSGGRPGLISVGASARLAPALTRYFCKRLAVPFKPIEKPEEEAARVKKEAAAKDGLDRKAAQLASEEAAAREASERSTRKEQAIRSVATILDIDENVSRTLLHEMSVALLQ